MDERTLKHAAAMLKDTENYPFVGDFIDQLENGKSSIVISKISEKVTETPSESISGCSAHPGRSRESGSIVA